MREILPDVSTVQSFVAYATKIGRDRFMAPMRPSVRCMCFTTFIAFLIRRFCFIIPSMKPCCELVCASAFFLSVSLGILAAEPEVSEKDLPRVPPTEPDKALATFQIKNGFRIELVAAEPLVVDPIALAFDENGRLF